MEHKEESTALLEPVVGEESQKKLNLFQSILMDDTESLNELLDERTNKFILRLRNRDALSRTPLYYASQLGKTEIVDRLLKTGACNIEDADSDGWTCLFVSCLYGKKDIVKLLLKNEAKTEAKEEKYGWTPLFAATCKDEVEIVKMLLQEGADVNVTDKSGRTPLWIAVMLEHTQIIHELIKHGASVNCTDDKGRTPAYIAVQMEKKKALEILVENNANLNLYDIDKRTPLILSYKLRLTDIQEYLQNNGADQTALEKEKQEEEESKFGPCRGIPVKNYKTNGAKIHCLTNTPGHVWGGTTDGSIFVWDLTGELITHVEKLCHSGVLDIISVEDEVWALTELKEIFVLKLSAKYLALKKKPEINDRKWIETNKVPTDDLEAIGCLMNYKDKSVYGGSINSTIYCWSIKIKPYTYQKIDLKVPESNPEPITKMLSTKDLLFVAKNRLIHVFSSETHVYQYTLEDHTDRITAMVEAQGKLWTASHDASIRVWDIEKKSCISVLENAHEGVLCLAAAGNAQVISGGKDYKIKSRSAKTIPLTREREKEFLSEHNHYIECMLWEPKSKQLWVASLDKSVSIWS